MPTAHQPVQTQAHSADGATPTGGHLPHRLFDATPEQRLARARRQFFDEGVRPTGTVAEAVIQSWTRCLQQRQNPARPPAFDPVTVSRVHSVLGRHRSLLQAAGNELTLLARTLAGTPVVGLLLDPDGVVMHVTPRAARPGERILPMSARIGVCLAEERIGTNAPALTAITGRPSLVQGVEHFAEAVGHLHCVAAPVHDPQGRLVAVLDLSVEGRPFGFDAAMLAGLSATAIENQWLRSATAAPLVLSLHCNPAMLDTALVGLVGVDAGGHVAWLNTAAARLLGMERRWPLPPDASTERWLGRSLAALLGMTGGAAARQLQLPSGLLLWVRATLRRDERAAAPNASDAAAPTSAMASAMASAVASAVPCADATGPGCADAPTQAPVATALPAARHSLREAEHSLVVRAVNECAGNVSQAARRLGVSRGLIYRQLRRCLDD